MIKRVTLRVFGPSILHVGYRDSVEDIANELKVVGTIQNMEDGSVQIVCEGEEDILKQFIKRIQIREEEEKPYLRKILVDEVQEVKWEKATGEFKSFTRIYPTRNEWMQNAAEELAIGRKALIGMATNFGEMTKAAKDLANEMKIFREETSSNIHYLGEKYHVISVVSFAVLISISAFGLYISSIYSNVVQPGSLAFLSIVVILALLWGGVIYFSVRHGNREKRLQIKSD